MASAIFTSGTFTGTAEVRATVAGFTATVPIVILGAGEPFTITLHTTPELLRVGDPPAQVTATVADAFGAAVPDGTLVVFATDLGTLSSPSAPTVGGQASVALAPGLAIGQAHLVAQAGGVEARLAKAILPGQAHSVSVMASPSELTVGYNQIARLTAEARDRYGNPVADGTPLTWVASLGRVTEPQVMTSGGRATLDFVGELIAGTSHITVTAPGGAQGLVQVKIHPAAPAQLTLAPEMPEMVVGSPGQLIRATVRDLYGNPVADSTPVAFGTSLGSLCSIAAGRQCIAPTAQLVALTTAGDAAVFLRPGVTSGAARVRAEVGPNLEQSVEVPIRPGPAHRMFLHTDPPAPSCAAVSGCSPMCETYLAIRWPMVCKSVLSPHAASLIRLSPQRSMASPLPGWLRRKRPAT